MISVLFLIPTLDRGGAENVLVDLVNHMDQSKFRITVQTLFDQDSQKGRLKKGIEYKSFLYHQFHGNSRLMSIVPAGLLYRMIVKKKYDIVVSYLEGPTTHILSGCPYPDSKRVAWIHVEMKTARQASAGFKSLPEACRAYQSFDRIIFVAETVREAFEKATESRFNNACVLYNTIDSEAIRNKSQEKISGAAFNPDEFNIISVGRIIDAKGFDRLASVQKKLKDAEYKTHVYILGSGQDREKIEEYTKQNSISDTFTFLGFQDNPYKYLAKADLFVCSSRREGFSTAVTEALILGIPVVSTNCSGAYELLGEDSKYGIVTENDEDALFEGLKVLLDDPVLLQKYRSAAEKRGQAFNSERTVNETEKMLCMISKSEEID